MRGRDIENTPYRKVNGIRGCSLRERVNTYIFLNIKLENTQTNAQIRAPIRSRCPQGCSAVCLFTGVDWEVLARLVGNELENGEGAW